MHYSGNIFENQRKKAILSSMPRTVKENIYDDVKKPGRDLSWQKRVYSKDDSREAIRLYRLLARLLHSPKKFPEHTDYRGLNAHSTQQLCVVKLNIGKDTAAHTRFIQEYLPQEHKKQVREKPELFSDGTVDSEFLSSYHAAMTGKHFKFIISPESQAVNCEALTRTLVKRLEALTGKRFSWMAAVHTDTDHTHAHLLINGTDKDGKDVYFDKALIKKTIREMSRQICTSMIGKRTPEDIRQSIGRAYKSCRYCFIDDAIKDREIAVSPDGSGKYASRVFPPDDLMRKRLVFLSELGFAERQKTKGREVFYLERDWKKKLKDIGRYNSFLNARSSLLSTAAQDLEKFTAETGVVQGTVTKLYKMNDEDSWNNAVLIENRALKKAWYVPLHFSPDEKLLNAQVKCGLKTLQTGRLVPRIIILRPKTIAGQRQEM
jgi:hypothetical protein